MKTYSPYDTDDISEWSKDLAKTIKSNQSSDTDFEVIVIGVGSMGSSTCYHLAKNGVKVLGLEQFDIPNEKASHTGQSRIIRKAYYEHPDYVPLLERSYENWNSLEQEMGIQLYYKTGLIYFGKKEGEFMDSIRNCARQYHIELHQYSQIEQQKRYPQFILPDHYECLFEPEAGFVTPERAILAYCSMALKHGAQISTHEKTIKWKEHASGFSVTTDKRSYTCKKLILTAGAWINELSNQSVPNLKITQQWIGWVHTTFHANYERDKFPCWIIEQEESKGIYYGFPSLPKIPFGKPAGLKLGYHYPGHEINPDSPDMDASNLDKDLMIRILNRYMPGAYESINALKSCLYTNSADDHFIIDFDTENKNVIIATGFSGHGFKFASAVGEILTDLAIEGKTKHPIDFLKTDRLQS